MISGLLRDTRCFRSIGYIFDGFDPLGNDLEALIHWGYFCPFWMYF